MRRLLAMAAAAVLGAAAPGPQAARWLVTNDDSSAPFPPSTIGVFRIGTDGGLGPPMRVSTEGNGMAGGAFAADRVVVADTGRETCVFAANAQSETVAAFTLPGFRLAGTFSGSHEDQRLARRGMPLAAEAGRLYAGFTGGGNIGTFRIGTGCRLAFAGDTPVRGLDGGGIESLAARHGTLLATYGDGSIETFSLDSPLPRPAGGASRTVAPADDFVPAAGVLTRDGRFAVLGGASTETRVQVMALADGRPGKVATFRISNGWNADGVRLSADEHTIFVSNSSGGRVTTAFFDPRTGQVRPGCESAPLHGFLQRFTAIGAVAADDSGAVYVPEYDAGGHSAIGLLRFSAAGRGCTLREAASSPFPAGPSSALLSIAIAAAPPR